jgi:hypothetical protein
MNKNFFIVTFIAVLTLAVTACQPQFIPATGQQPVNPQPQNPQPQNPQPMQPGPQEMPQGNLPGQPPQQENPLPGGPQQGVPQSGQPQPGMPGPNEPRPMEPNPAGPQPAMGGEAQIISFPASRNTMYPGQCAMLDWNTQGGFGATLNNQPVERVGQEEVCPTTTTSYILRVDNGKEMQQREILINVTPDNNSQNSGSNPSSNNNSQNPGNNSGNGNNNQNSGGCSGAPVFQFFTANSTSITSGQSVTLSWGNITNGNTGPLVKSAVIDPGLGEVGSGASSRTVTPNTTTTYTLTATGCGGTSSKQVTVTVNNAGSGNSTTPTIKMIPAQVMNLDLAVDNVYPASNGHIMVTIKNTGNVVVSGSYKIVCSGSYVDSGGNHALSLAGQYATIGLSQNQKADFDTSYSRNPSISSMSVTCTITPPNGDSNSGNNTKAAKVK